MNTREIYHALRRAGTHVHRHESKDDWGGKRFWISREMTVAEAVSLCEQLTAAIAELAAVIEHMPAA